MASQKQIYNIKSSYQEEYLPFDKRLNKEGTKKHSQLNVVYF